MGISQAIHNDILVAQTKRRQLTRYQRRNLWFYIFISPFLFGLFFLTIFPIGYGFYISLTNYDGFALTGIKFVGFENYQRAFRDPYVWLSLRQTLLWIVLNVPAWIISSFCIALLLNRKIRFSGAFRTLYYLPTVIPAVAVVTIWKIVLDRNAGLLNGLLSLVRPGTALPWLGQYALWGTLAMSVWSSLGWGMVIFLAGLQGIPNELVEAAHIDGAGSGGIFRHITLPLMTPVLFFQIIMSLIGAFQQFLFPLLIGTSQSVPNVPRSIYFFMVFTFLRIQEGFYGYGLALLWLLFTGIILLTALIFWSERFWVYKGDI